MTENYIRNLHKAFYGEKPEEIPIFASITMRFVVEYNGIKLDQYLSNKEAMLESQLKVREDIGNWVLPRPNLGPFVEPATLGCEITIDGDQNALRSHVLKKKEDLDRLQIPNPYSEGMMGEILQLGKWMRKQLDSEIPIRPGMAFHPFSLAYCLRGEQFFRDLIDDPMWAHNLLDFSTEVATRYAKAQEEVFGTTIPIFHSDDIAEMISTKHYREFAKPYTNKLFEATRGWNVFHECGNSAHLWDFLPESMNIFETGPPEKISLKQARERLPNVCLVGNISSTNTMLEGSPSEVRDEVKRCIDEGGKEGLIIGLSGGVLPNVPSQNLKTLNQVVKEFS